MKVALFALLLMMAAASSRAELHFGGGAHAGLAFSTFADPTSKYYGVGFGGGASAELNIMKYLGVRLDVDYHSFPSDKEELKHTADPLGRLKDLCRRKDGDTTHRRRVRLRSELRLRSRIPSWRLETLH